MTIETRPPSFGRTLLSARLEKGMSIKDISRETRIGIDTIFLIENEDVQRLPAPVFSKGFLRAYAKIVGVDGDTVVSLYSDSLEEIKENDSLSADVEKANAGFWWRISISVGIVLAAAVVMLYLDKLFWAPPSPIDRPVVETSAGRPDSSASLPVPHAEGSGGNSMGVSKASIHRSEGNAGASARLPGEMSSGGRETFPSSPGSVTGKNLVSGNTADENTVRNHANPPSDRLLLQIEADEATWLKIIVDVESPVEYRLKAGDKLELEASDGFNLLVGNAGGIRLILNGNPVAVPGRQGQVVNLQLP